MQKTDNKPISIDEYKVLALKAEADGHYEMVEECWRRAIDLARQQRENASILNALLECISNFYARINKFDLAIEPALESWRLKLDAFGSNSTMFASAADRLAALYFSAGDMNNALRYGLFSLQSVEVIFGNYSDAVADACLNLATVHRLRNDFEDAKHYLDRAYSIRASLFGAQDQRTVQVAAAQLDLSRAQARKQDNLRPHPDDCSVSKNSNLECCDFCGTVLPQGSNSCSKCRTVVGRPII